MKDKLEHRLLARFHKAIFEYGLIEEGDKILIGLSGGKDSLFLMEMLGRQMQIFKPRFSLYALHIRMDHIDYKSDTEFLQSFAYRYKVPFHVETTDFSVNANSSKPPCFLCSWYRRKKMFQEAQRLGCNKIALGHHLDDLVHTALMNTFFQGRFSTMPAMLKMKKMPITIIRPLFLEEEKDIRTYAKTHNYVKQLKLCPHETDSKRHEMATLFQSLEQMNPEARYSILTALKRDGKLFEGLS